MINVLICLYFSNANKNCTLHVIFINAESESYYNVPRAGYDF